jgi:hypothetical protein
MELPDLKGGMSDPLRAEGAKAVVFLFISVDCPISNAYAPEFRRLDADFTPKGIAFRIVYPNREESAQVIRQHIKDYEYPFKALRDPRHLLCQASGVRVTPEAAVFVFGRGWVYHGRIDDRNVELGRERTAVTHQDLRAVLGEIVDGKTPAVSSSRAIGCSISPLR